MGGKKQERNPVVTIQCQGDRWWWGYVEMSVGLGQGWGWGKCFGAVFPFKVSQMNIHHLREL